MKYCCPECAGCNTKDQKNSCVQIALEFALDNGEKVLVRLCDWHGEKGAAYLASFMCRRKDGSLFSLAAIPRYVLDSIKHEKGPVKGSTFDQVDMVLGGRTQAICERVFCCGQTHFSKTTVNAQKHHYEEEERSRFFGFDYRARKRQTRGNADIERYCVPAEDGVKVVDCLTEDHLRRIRYMGSDDWE